MAYQVEIVEVDATPLAAVRERVAWSDLSRSVPQLLGEVWTFLKSASAGKSGHNVAVYHAPRPDDVDLECGVQLEGSFEPAGRVHPSHTPAGRAAHVVFLGEYRGLGSAHDAIEHFCREHGYVKGVCWEVYGDWDEDPAKLRTDVYALVTSKA